MGLCTTTPLSNRFFDIIFVATIAMFSILFIYEFHAAHRTFPSYKTYLHFVSICKTSLRTILDFSPRAPISSFDSQYLCYLPSLDPVEGRNNND